MDFFFGGVGGEGNLILLRPIIIPSPPKKETRKWFHPWLDSFFSPQVWLNYWHRIFHHHKNPYDLKGLPLCVMLDRFEIGELWLVLNTLIMLSTFNVETFVQLADYLG